MIFSHSYLFLVNAEGKLLPAEELRDLLAEGVGVVAPPVELGRAEGGVAEGDDVIAPQVAPR